MSIDDRYYFFLLYQKEMLKAYTYNVINPFNVDDLDTNSLNLKIELKDHQKVMLKKIIEIINKEGKFEAVLSDDKTKISGSNSNIWLKLDVGVGKSLIMLSLISYFKSHPINPRVAASTDLATRISLNKELAKNAELIDPCFMELIKDCGMVIDQSLTHEFITYNEVGDLSILFAQSQVIQQFETYIEEQTNLSYVKISSPQDVLDFMINPSFDKDLLLLDTDNIQTSIVTVGMNGINMFFDVLNGRLEKEGKERMSAHELNMIYSKANELFKIRDYQMMQHTRYLNKFLYDLQRIYGKPFKFLLFDDYDLIRMTSFFKPHCLYSIYVSGTKIRNDLVSGLNCIKLFAEDDFINSLSCVTMDANVVQSIIKIPEHTNSLQQCKPIYSSIVDTLLFGLISSCVRNADTLSNKDDKDNKENKEKTIVKLPDFEQLLLYVMSLGKDFTKIYKTVFAKDVTTDQLTNEMSLFEFYRITIYFIAYMELFMQFVSGEIADKEIRAKKSAHLKFLYSKLEEDAYLAGDDLHIRAFVQFAISQLSAIKKRDMNDKVQKIFKFIDTLKEIVNQFTFKLNTVLKNMKARTHITKEFINDSAPIKTYILSCCNNLISKKEIKHIFCRNDNGLHCKFCGASVKDISKAFIPTTFIDDEFIDFVMNGELDKIPFDEKDDTIYDIEVYDRIKKTLKVFEENPDAKFLVYITSTYEEEKLKNLLRILHKIIPSRWTKDITEAQKKCIFVNSLKEIIGVNMTWVDHVIIYDEPQNLDEIKQIIGRTHRLGRTTPTASTQLHIGIDN